MSADEDPEAAGDGEEPADAAGEADEATDATAEADAPGDDGEAADATAVDESARGEEFPGEWETADSPATEHEGEPLLEVRNLDAGYGDLQVLDDVDLQVMDGEYVTVVGPNGAGKSTVMKSVFGLTTFIGGSIRFDDQEIAGEAPEEIIHYGVGYVPQNENVFSGLSVRENLEMGAYILDEVPQDRLEAVFDRFPILEERQGQKAGTLSGGQQQMLAMGRALMLDPDLLLLDEPSAGLAPDLVKEMFDRIDTINDDGTAILMVEQNAKEALRRCDRGYVLVQGENRYVDSGDALLGDEEVRQQFLGG